MIRLLAVHDAVGRIVGLMTSPSDAPEAAPLPAPGLFVSQVKLPNVPADDSWASDTDRLVEIIDRYRLDIRTMELSVRTE